jgi:hypothetical protein
LNVIRIDNTTHNIGDTMKVGDLVRVRSSGVSGVIRKILPYKFAEVLIFDDGKRKQYHIGHLGVIGESR